MGSYEKHLRYSSWSGSCKVCSKQIQWPQGIFCSNSYSSVGGFPPCHKMWCGGCYTSCPKTEFHIHKSEDLKLAERSEEDIERLEARWGKRGLRPLDYKIGRDGDSLLIPFECDLCIFRKLRFAEPKEKSPSDQLLLACIRRMQLDAFWSLSSYTVKGNCYKVKQILKCSDEVGLKGPFEYQGPFPSYDYCGYELGVDILLYSKHKGVTDTNHLQYDTIRKFQSAYGNFVRSTPKGASQLLTMLDDKGRYK